MQLACSAVRERRIQRTKTPYKTLLEHFLVDETFEINRPHFLLSIEHFNVVSNTCEQNTKKANTTQLEP